jgi:DNA-binding NarL/FixJ family response regulator
MSTSLLPPVIDVAIVEDMTDLGESIRLIVDSMPNARCIGLWPTAEEGLKKIEAFRPQVVLMDINLPGISGIAATARLKEFLPEIQVIMLTVYRDHDKIFDALKAGASGYLLKRSSPDKLREAVSTVCQGGAPMNAEIARRVVEAFHRPLETKEQDVLLDLTKRESEILELIADGLANKEIAHQLDISVETARVHLKHIYEKLHVRSRTEAAMRYRDSLEKRPWLH